MWATSPISPVLPLSATITARSSVPTAKEIVAAANVPVDLPSPALMGACRATPPPTTAMIRTANPLSMGVIFADSRCRGSVGATLARSDAAAGHPPPGPAVASIRRRGLWPPLFRAQPVLADTDVDGQRWIELEGAAHLALDQLGRGVHLGRG